jgi:iron complex outermembrane recepter protein
MTNPILLTMTACCALFLNSAAFAQSAPADEVDAEVEEAKKADEIIVIGVRENAIRRANRSASGLLDVPVQQKPRAIEIIDGEAIRQQIFTGEDDLIRNIPGALNNSTGRGQGVRITLRGLNTGIAIDGVSSGDNSANIEPELIESIEVQRGVSGLETSAVSFGDGGGAGGTVNLLRKYPQAKGFAEFFANGDQWGRWRTGVDLNLPLGEGTQGLRLNAAYGKNKTYFRGEQNGDYIVVGLSGTWRPTDDLIIDAAADYVREGATFSYNLSPSNGNYTFLPRIDRRQSYTAPWSFATGDKYRANVKATYVLSDNWALQGTVRQEWGNSGDDAAYYYYFFGADLDTGDVNTVAFVDDGGSSRIFSGDLKLKGEFKTGNVDHLITFGASKFSRTDKNANAPTYFGDVGLNNIYAWVPPPRPDPLDISDPIPPGPDQFRKDSSFFFQTRSTLNDKFDLWLGGRYSKFSTTISGGTVSSVPAKDNFFTPIVSLAWRPNGNHTLYGTFAESVSPGLIVDDFYANVGTIIPPLKVKQYEIGWKWNAKPFGLNITAFSTQEPFTIETPSAGDPDIFDLNQGGLNQFRGIEFGASYDRGNLSLGAGIVFLDAIVKDSGDPAFDGSKSSGVARQTGYVSVDYRNLFTPKLDAGASLRFQSKTPLGSETPFNAPGYSLLDAYISYALGSEDKPLTLRLAASNLTNNYYYEIFDSGFSFFPGAPRTVRFEISKRF